MQDSNACFHPFKAIETETAPTNPDGASAPGTLNLHPLPPMIKQLPPGFGPKLGPEHQAYNQVVSFVMNLDNNSPGMLWLVKNALDVDGRDTGATKSWSAAPSSSVAWQLHPRSSSSPASCTPRWIAIRALAPQNLDVSSNSAAGGSVAEP